MAAVGHSIAVSDLIEVSLREAVSILLLLYMGIIPWVAGVACAMRQLKIGQSSAP